MSVEIWSSEAQEQKWSKEATAKIPKESASLCSTTRLTLLPQSHRLVGWREHGVGLLQKDVRPIAEKQPKNLLRDIVHCLRQQQKQAALKLELLSAECKRKED